MADRITHARLLEVLDYDCESGLFRWKRPTSTRTKAGDVAGCLDSSTGYVKIRVDGVLYRASHLAWLYVHGRWPRSSVVDHRNGKPGDNRIKNLRLASFSTNAINRIPTGAARDLPQGVEMRQRPDGSVRYRARIRFAGKLQFLGNFETVEQAVAAYFEAKKALHPTFERWRELKESSHDVLRPSKTD